MNRDELKEAMEIPVFLGATSSVDRHVELSFIPYSLKYIVTYETEKVKYENDKLGHYCS